MADDPFIPVEVFIKQPFLKPEMAVFGFVLFLALSVKGSDRFLQDRPQWDVVFLEKGFNPAYEPVVDHLIGIVSLLVISVVDFEGEPADPVVESRVFSQRLPRHRLQYFEEIVLRLFEICVIFARCVVEKAVFLRVGQMPDDAFKPEEYIIQVFLHVLRQVFKLTGMRFQDGIDHVLVMPQPFRRVADRVFASAHGGKDSLLVVSQPLRRVFEYVAFVILYRCEDDLFVVL